MHFFYFIAAVYNDCVSSSERVSIASNRVCSNCHELPNAVERMSKGTEAVADPGGGPGGSVSPIRPDTCLRLKSLQR